MKKDERKSLVMELEKHGIDVMFHVSGSKIVLLEEATSKEVTMSLNEDTLKLPKDEKIRVILNYFKNNEK